MGFWAILLSCRQRNYISEDGMRKSGDGKGGEQDTKDKREIHGKQEAYVLVWNLSRLDGRIKSQS
jgi:hypothetical protein